MHHRNHGGWGSFLWVFATGIGLARLFGWPWDKIWRHHLGWLVILYAAMLGLRLGGELWLAIYNHVPHVLLLLAFVGWLALWALRQHVRHPWRRGP